MTESAPAANTEVVLNLILADHAQLIKQATILRVAWLDQVEENSVLRQQIASLQQQLTELAPFTEREVPDAS